MRVRVNGREYALDFTQYTVADFRKLIALHGDTVTPEFNRLCDEINDRIIGIEKISFVPAVDMALLIPLIQKELMRITFMLAQADPSKLSEVEILDEQEEDEIENFIRKLK